MAWSWSHTAEAYASLSERIGLQSREWLQIVYAEWEAAEPDDDGGEAGFNEAKYKEALAHAKTLDGEVLADYIYTKAEEQALCTNGGWEAWCCPWGCHLLSFSEVPKCDNCGEPNRRLKEGLCKDCR